MSADLQHAAPRELVPGAEREVSASVAERVRASKSPNTIRAYRTDVAAYAAWCAEHGHTALPADGVTFAEYVDHLCTLGRAPSTVKRAMAAIRKLHEEAGHLDLPPRKLAADVLLGYRRQRAASPGGNRQKKAPPISQESLRLMVETCDGRTLVDRRDHLLLVLGVALMGRRSELVALRVGDVMEDERGLLVWVAQSKTDQAAEGEEVAIERGTWPDTDPVRAFRAWREVLAERDELDGPLLRGLAKGGRLLPRLSAESVNHIVRARAVRAHLPNAERYTAHSLRAGGMTASLKAGALLGVAIAHGRWSPNSTVALGYARVEDRWRDNPMRGVL